MIDYSVERPIAVITLQNPPVNAFGAELRAEVLAALERANSDARVQAIVITGLDIVEAGLFQPEADARKLIDQGTRDLMESDAARALLEAFFAERAARKAGA